MSAANANATATTAADKLDGLGDSGELDFRKAALFYTARMFGLSKDYAFPVGSNVTASLLNHGTSLAKLLTRKMKMPDGNEYDLWDAIMTIAKSVIIENPRINDGERNSVNYKAS